MRYLFIATSLLLIGCHDDLERRVNYIYELVRGRNIDTELCTSYSGPEMDCSIAATDSGKMACRCTFTPDAQDERNTLRQEAINLMAKELQEAKDAESSTDSDGGTDSE